MAHDSENNSGILEIIAIAVIVFFIWKYSRKKKLAIPVVELSKDAKPLTDAEVEAQFTQGNFEASCKNIIYRPLSTTGLTGANLLGKDYCYRGDGSNINPEAGFGDAYAEKQAEVYEARKEAEAQLINSKSCVQFRLINSTAVKATVQVLDITQQIAPFEPIPDAPIAIIASGITESSFTANWNNVLGANGYFLDVSTDINFNSFVTGYQNLNVGNVLSEVLFGLSNSTNYYYRLRTYSNSGTSINSNVASLKTKTIYDNWFLPSMDELSAMYNELKVYGVGNFSQQYYWSSSEASVNASWFIKYLDGSVSFALKTAFTNYYVRACRAFTSTTSYSLRDIGPAGGYVFWKSGNNYMEAAPSDQSNGYIWSNINGQLIGTTGTTIGTGQANTTAIINQVGHTNSAAKLCDDLIVIN